MLEVAVEPMAPELPVNYEDEQPSRPRLVAEIKPETKGGDDKQQVA